MNDSVERAANLAIDQATRAGHEATGFQKLMVLAYGMTAIARAIVVAGNSIATAINRQGPR